jgi:succinate dehydrogenase / fumarate reductase, membrane anchor subunit
MITNVTSLTGNGLKDWLIQRVTAIYMLIYIISAMIWFVVNMPFQYSAWFLWCHSPIMQVSTALMLLCLLLHAWIGLWTVTTDYIKSTILRVSLQSVIGFFLMGQFIWGLIIIWGS